MKIRSYIFCLLLFAGCKSSGNKAKPDTIITTKVISTVNVKKTDEKVFKPYSLNADYIVIDTGEYSNGPMGGLYAIVKHESQIDTIDRGCGITKLGNKSYLYQALTDAQSDDFKNSKGSLALDFGNYTMVIDGKRIKLKDVIKNFDNYFSSASAIKGKIYFWQLDRADTTGMISVCAAQFDPITNKTISHFLMKDGVETDDSGYFPQPYIEHDRIIFSLDDRKKWSYSLSFN